jgi:hypothetical protein
MFEPLRAGLHSETHAVCASKQMSTLSPENAPPNRRTGIFPPLRHGIVVLGIMAPVPWPPKFPLVVQHPLCSDGVIPALWRQSCDIPQPELGRLG